MPPARPTLADPFYYLNHFSFALASVQQRYGALLSGEERHFIAQFPALPQASRALLVRMIMRRGTLFRASRLRYPEIGDVAAAATPLLNVAWLEEPSLDAAALHGLLTKGELLTCLVLTRQEGRLGKAALLDLLRERHAGSQPLHEWWRDSQDRVFHCGVKPLAERFQLLFFGNFHQDWSEFVLAALGVNAYESAPALSARFRTRAQIDAFLQLHRCRRELAEGLALEQVVAKIPAPIEDSDWLEDLRQRLLFKAASAWERRDPAAALTVLATCRYRGARMRSVRLLARRQEWRAAYELCMAARADPESESETQQVHRLLPRLNRRLGFAVEKTSGSRTVASFDLWLDTLPADRPLEVHIRDRLHDGPDTTVHYVENGLINSLFGLLCWEVIFAPIPEAFFHDFQYGPADLESGRFLERRRARFAQCLAELESDRYPDIIRRRFAAKSGLQSPFVAWGLLSERLLDLALECFPAVHLRLWFEWILQDLVDNRAGFPDLVQFWPGERRYRLVEVKGPGDRLQDNQRRFLEFCTAHGMPVSVCRVKCTVAPVGDGLRLFKAGQR